MKKLFLAAVAMLTVCAASAQNELITKYNEAAAAMQSKDFATAVQLFDEVIDEGMDSEDPTVLNCVATAKRYIPAAYTNMAIASASKKDYDTAAEYLTTATDRAELYGETQALSKAKTLLAKVYQAQGAEAYNNKDYATAAEVFAKGYAANPRNTEMALNLAMSYCESGEYDKGMEVYRNVAAMNPEKYGEAVATAQKMMAQYTNNKLATLQAANDYEGIVAMSEKMLEADPTDALAYKVRLQAYNSMKDYDKVIELGPEAAAAQFTPEAESDIWFMVGAAYNVKDMKPQAVEALKKVVAGPNAAAAKKSVDELTK